MSTSDQETEEDFDRGLIDSIRSDVLPFIGDARVSDSIITQLVGLKCEPHDKDKMAAFLQSMRDVTRFASTLEVLRVASTTFKDMVASILDKDG